MNALKYLKISTLPIALLMSGFVFTACTDDIMVGKPVDEEQYESVTRLEGMLLDKNTNKKETVIELRTDKYQTNVYFSLTRKPNKGVDVEVKFDPAYLETYNAEHGTDFELFPEKFVKIENDGLLLLAPDEKYSANVGLTLSKGDGLKADKTYVVPITAVSATDGITLSESASRVLYLVKNFTGESDCNKGPDAMKTVLFFEVNDTNPLNALEFILEDSGKLFFDEIVLFAANINYDAEKGRVYVYNNPETQFLLDNNEQYLQPLRKRGMKVILCILGNHDASGVAQLSEIGAKQFAQELAAYCYAYNLDGVGFDDEYSRKPDLNNPLFAPWSVAAASRLLYETKKAMPDKTVMVYYLGRINTLCPAINGIQPGEFVDYAVADYGMPAPPMVGMTRRNCAGMSIELNRSKGNWDEETARSMKASGYGYYMFFALGGTNTLVDNFDYYKVQVNRCQSACRGLYEEELLMPEYYYKQYDTTRYKLP